MVVPAAAAIHAIRVLVVSYPISHNPSPPPSTTTQSIICISSIPLPLIFTFGPVLHSSTARNECPTVVRTRVQVPPMPSSLLSWHLLLLSSCYTSTVDSSHFQLCGLKALLATFLFVVSAGHQINVRSCVEMSRNVRNLPKRTETKGCLLLFLERDDEAWAKTGDRRGDPKISLKCDRIAFVFCCMSPWMQMWICGIYNITWCGIVSCSIPTIVEMNGVAVVSYQDSSVIGDLFANKHV